MHVVLDSWIKMPHGVLMHTIERTFLSSLATSPADARKLLDFAQYLRSIHDYARADLIQEQVDISLSQYGVPAVNSQGWARIQANRRLEMYLPEAEKSWRALLELPHSAILTFTYGIPTSIEDTASSVARYFRRVQRDCPTIDSLTVTDAPFDLKQFRVFIKEIGSAGLASLDIGTSRAFTPGHYQAIIGSPRLSALRHIVVPGPTTMLALLSKASKERNHLSHLRTINGTPCSRIGRSATDERPFP